MIVTNYKISYEQCNEHWYTKVLYNFPVKSDYFLPSFKKGIVTILPEQLIKDKFPIQFRLILAIILQDDPTVPAKENNEYILFISWVTLMVFVWQYN